MPFYKGDEIRELKKSKADKATLQPHIDALIALKTQFKDETGKAYVAPGATANASGGGGAKKQPKKVRNRRYRCLVKATEHHYISYRHIFAAYTWCGWVRVTFLAH